MVVAKDSSVLPRLEGNDPIRLSILIKPSLDGGFKYCLFSSRPGGMIHFDIYHMGWLKPPTKNQLENRIF